MKPLRLLRDGRPHLLGEVVAIGPGVWQNDRGAMHCGRGVLERSVVAHAAWQSLPVTAGHPAGRGDPRPSEVIGRLMAATVNALGRVRGRVWLDERAADRIDPRVRAALLGGGPVEVSVGFVPALGPAPRGLTVNGAAVTAGVRSLRPTHLALLVNGQRGACGCADGYGLTLLRSSAERKRGKAMARTMNFARGRIGGGPVTNAAPKGDKVLPNGDRVLPNGIIIPSCMESLLAAARRGELPTLNAPSYDGPDDSDRVLPRFTLNSSGEVVVASAPAGDLVTAGHITGYGMRGVFDVFGDPVSNAKSDEDNTLPVPTF